MKRILKKYNVLSTGILLGAMVLFGQGCDDKMQENYYTFTGEMMADYLQNRAEEFSMFTEILKRTPVMGRLALYGEYTCFAPTNKAILTYFEEKGIGSIDQLTDAECDTLAYNHLLNEVCYTIDVTDDVLFNMNEKPISITVDTLKGYTNEVYFVDNSQLIVRDDSVENGVVHTIDRVLVPTSKLLPDLMEQDTTISWFCQALRLTGLDDAMRLYRDESYEALYTEDELVYDTGYEFGERAVMPLHRKYGYTAFVEPNSVYKANQIHSFEELKAHANRLYPELANEDYTSENNALHKFVSYHLLARTAYYEKLTYTVQVVPGYESLEFLPTLCPNSLVKITNDSRTGIFLNRDKSKKQRGILIQSPSENRKVQKTAINGVYHYINGILQFDSAVRDTVLNTRVRVDATSLLPELMSNDCRCSTTTNYYFPSNYFETMQCSNETKVVVRYRRPWFWSYDGDELLFLGQYDFTVQMPPVPAGTYEIRLGYCAISDAGTVKTRGVIQAYVDNIPCGIPLDLRIEGTNPKIGWVKDSETDDKGYQNDKDMRNRRYMKGPDVVRFMAENGNPLETFRDQYRTVRRIITTTYLDEGIHTLRFRTVLENPKSVFPFDYMELCPKSLYDNPAGEDKH